MISQNSPLWNYLSPEQRVLAGDGAFLIVDSERHRDQEPTDYSYVVFPFAKMYEGFLKQLFRDLGIISDRDYASERFRIGKALSPNLERVLGRGSVYGELRRRYGESLADGLWRTWKDARNLVFHYFPHNYRSLTRDQAIALIRLITDSMATAVAVTHVQGRPHP